MESRKFLEELGVKNIILGVSIEGGVIELSDLLGMYKEVFSLPRELGDIEIMWTKRYSGTDKPDNLGRWARVGYLEHKSKDPTLNCQIAWIKKVRGKYCTYVYLGSGEFENSFTDLDEAKEYCKQMVIDFYRKYLES